MGGSGRNGTSGTKRKRAGGAKRPKSPTNAQRAAWRRIVAESGIAPTKEGMEAILRELRRE
jgi:hypothetical protein